jgi:hypothetical protein
MTLGADCRPSATVAQRSPGQHRCKPLTPWFLAGLGVRLALAPFTSHPFDMSVWISHQARLFNAGLNPLFNWKFSLPMMGVLLSTFLPALGTSHAFRIPQVLALQFWIKLPFIAADLWIALLLRRCIYRATLNEREGRRAALVWLFNPIAIFYTAVHGQFDALPAALMLFGFALIQERQEARAFGALLLSGTAKYFGYLLVPMLWAWGGTKAHGGTRAARMGIATAVVASLGFASVAVPGLGGSLFGGLASDVTGSKASLWSLWGPLASLGQLGLWWIPLFACLYVGVLVELRLRRSSHAADPLRFLGAATGTLAILMALDPFANPQFYIWVMPLLIVLAFAHRSLLLLSLTAALGYLNLFAFWRSENPEIWFLNTVPGASSLRGFWFPPHGFVDLSAARTVGFAYGLGLILVGVLALFPSLRRGIHRPRTLNWRLGVSGTTVIGSLCSLGFVAYTFQPSLLGSYASGPAYPADLPRLNSLRAARVEWIPGQAALKAYWNDVDQKLVAGGVSRARIQVVGATPLEPSIKHTVAGEPVPISAAGINLTFGFSSSLSPRHVAIKIILGNASYGSPGGPELPTFSLATGPGLQENVPLLIDAEETPASGWFFVMLNQANASRGRRYLLSVRDPSESGWSWQGGPSGQIRPPSASTTSQRWMEAWSFRGTRDAVLRVLDDGRLELSRPLRSASELDHATIEIPPALSAESLPDVFVALDVVSDPWWLSSPRIAAVGFILIVLAPFLFAAVAWFIAGWGWTRVKG